MYDFAFLLDEALLGMQSSTDAKTGAMTMIVLFKQVFITNDPEVKLMKTVATVQCQGLSACASAVVALKRLHDSGADAEARLKADPNLALLTVIQQNNGKREAYQKELAGVREQAQSNFESVKNFFGGQEQLLLNMQSLLDMDLAQIIKEHRIEDMVYDDIFKDCVRLHAANISKKLVKCGEDAVEACKGWQQGSSHFWRGSAAPDATVADLQKLAARSIKATSPRDLKQTTDDFIAAPGSDRG